MVEPVFLAALAVVFILILIFILKGTNASDVPEQKKQKIATKEKKQRPPKKNALKKDKRPSEMKEWSEVYTPAKDAQDMLEFLKGKDPAEIAKHSNQPKQQQQQVTKKKSSKKVGNESSEESANGNEIVSEDGFAVISNKKPKIPKDNNETKKKKNNKKEDAESKSPKPKAFFKEDEEKKEEKKEKKFRGDKRAKDDASIENGERKKFDKPRRDDKQPGEDKAPREERPPRKAKSEGEDDRQKKAPIAIKKLPIVPPNVKYEEANLDDILNSITAEYKPKAKVHRIGSIFSKIPRSIIISILCRLEARDLVAVSEVNHYFSGAARKEPLWKDLALRDFNIRDATKYRGFRAAYKAEFKKRRFLLKKKNLVAAPLDDAKDVVDDKQ